jgi:hypothetical protein
MRMLYRKGTLQHRVSSAVFDAGSPASCLLRIDLSFKARVGRMRGLTAFCGAARAAQQRLAAA